MKIFLVVFTLSFLFLSCAYNKTELPLPQQDDEPTITYTNFVKSMIDSNHCLECHVPGVGEPAPWDYRTYNGIKTVAISGALKTRAIDRIGPDPMPKGFPALSQGIRDTLLMWINQGAQQ